MAYAQIVKNLSMTIRTDSAKDLPVGEDLSVGGDLSVRYDHARFTGKTKRTPQGFLKVPAFFTRAGVFEYRRADGSTVKELRPEDEVFHEDSLSTLASAPVVVDHPAERMVSPANAKKLAVGWASEKVDREDFLVSGSVTIMDQTTIDSVFRKDLKEISMGYRCRIDTTSGNHPVFGPYDQIQRDIKYNHVALGAESWGRAGGECSLRLDSGDAVQSTDWQDQKAQPRADTKKRQTMDETIVIGGVEFTVPKAAAQAFRGELSRNDTRLKELEAEKEKLEGRLDAAEGSLKKVNEELEKANDPNRFDSAVTERLDLISKAKKVLGEDKEIKGSKREIMENVIKSDSADLDLSEKSDDYVEARFDAFIEGFGKKKSNLDIVRSDAADAAKTVKNTAEEARKRMLERNANAWKVKGE